MPNTQNDQFETQEPDDGPAVAAIFAPGGDISGAIRNFEPRPQQARMAEAVYQAISQRSHLAVEAGTGVGKSLAYLAPAALWAARNKKKVVVATHTKALQAQLVKKDLPVVKAILAARGLPLSYFLLMGSSNYLCRSRLGRAGKFGPELFDAGGANKAVEDLLEWARPGTSGCRPEIHSRCRRRSGRKSAGTPISAWGKNVR
jgi:ATP-dependent DNA helicase DinG